MAVADNIDQWVWGSNWTDSIVALNRPSLWGPHFSSLHQCWSLHCCSSGATVQLNYTPGLTQTFARWLASVFYTVGSQRCTLCTACTHLLLHLLLHPPNCLAFLYLLKREQHPKILELLHLRQGLSIHPRRASYHFPVLNHGLRVRSADSHPGCLPLGQCTLTKPTWPHLPLQKARSIL